MKYFKSNGLSKFALCLFVSVASAVATYAQSYVRYINPTDLITQEVYSDSVLTSILLPEGVSRVSDYLPMNMAAFELAQVLRDPSKEVLQVWVCGSTSPDGMWADNVGLCQRRTESVVNYLKSVMHLPDYMIHAENLYEDWDRLYDMVKKSQIPYREEVLYIISTKEWGERKKALQNLAGGRVWRILLDDFFPKLRCVRFAIFCKWDPSKPYMTDPSAYHAPSHLYHHQVAPQPEMSQPAAEVKATVDTVFVRDTVVIMKEIVMKEITTPEVVEPVAAAPVKESFRHDTPYMMGFKTNLLADAIAVPSFGVELQMGKRLSLELQGWMTAYNIFNPSDKTTNIYGFSPEVRLWMNPNHTMRKGSFVGLSTSLLWYTLEWTDGFLYQNGPENLWEGYYHNPGNSTPAWSLGFNYGYSLGLGRKAHWGLEFVIGIGYAKYRQNTAVYNAGVWELVEHQNNHHIGITKAGINLTYRFSCRKVKPEFYDNN